MARSSVRREVVFRDADHLVVWLSIEKGSAASSQSERRSLLNAEIQAVCNDHISTLDDTLHKKSPRPNPVPRVFMEQGNDLSQILWLRWEA